MHLLDYYVFIFIQGVLYKYGNSSIKNNSANSVLKHFICLQEEFRKLMHLIFMGIPHIIEVCNLLLKVSKHILTETLYSSAPGARRII